MTNALDAGGGISNSGTEALIAAANAAAAFNSFANVLEETLQKLKADVTLEIQTEYFKAIENINAHVTTVKGDINDYAKQAVNNALPKDDPMIYPQRLAIEE